MKSKLTLVAIASFALSSWAADSALVPAIERTFDALEQRVKVLSGRVDEMSSYVECFVSNRVVTITGEYESRLKTRLDKFDEEIGDAVKDKEFYSKRYAELKAAEDRFMCHVNMFWMAMAIVVAIVGVFATWFGICKPQKNEKLIKIEWGKTQKELKELNCQVLRNIDELNKANTELRKDSVKSLHMCLLQCIQAIDIGVSSSSSSLDMANFICSIVICFDDLLECAMRTKDEGVVKDEVAAFRPFLERWHKSDILERQDIWKKSICLLKEAMLRRTNLSRRKDFIELLGETEIFKWLEDFYKEFAEWKLG